MTNIADSVRQGGEQLSDFLINLVDVRNGLGDLLSQALAVMPAQAVY